MKVETYPRLFIRVLVMMSRRTGHSSFILSRGSLPALRSCVPVLSRAAGGFGPRIVDDCGGALARGCHDLQGTAGRKKIYQE